MNELTSKLCTCNMNRSSMYRIELCAQPVHPLRIASATIEQTIPQPFHGHYRSVFACDCHGELVCHISTYATYSVQPWTPRTQLAVSQRVASGWRGDCKGRSTRTPRTQF